MRPSARGGEEFYGSHLAILEGPHGTWHIGSANFFSTRKIRAMLTNDASERLLDDQSDPRYAAIRDVIIGGRTPKLPLEATVAAFAKFVEERGPKVLANAVSKLLEADSTASILSSLADALADLQTLAHMKEDLKWVKGRARLFDVPESLLLECLNSLILRATEVSAVLLMVLPNKMLRDAGISKAAVRHACRDVLSGERRRRERAKTVIDTAIQDLSLASRFGTLQGRTSRATTSASLSRNAHKVFMFLKGQPSASTYDDIAGALDMGRGTISKSLKELDALGLIARPHGKHSGVVLK